MPTPDISNDDIIVSDDPKPSQNHSTVSSVEINDENVIPSHQALNFLDDPEVDIRPRFYDHISKQWILLDTGAQVSIAPPQEGDTLDPHLRLEAVDGSNLPCYGKKNMSVRIGRKTYHQNIFISNTSEVIFGMDFIMKNKIEFFWGEFGDYYMYDRKSQTRTLLQFIKIPKQTLPRACAVKVVASSSLSHHNSPWQAFQAAAVDSITAQNPLPNTIPPKYQQLINKYPEILTPDFTKVKHNVVHAIDTSDNTPIRTKVRPLLPGSPKAVAGKAAWDQMIQYGIVEKIKATETNYWSSGLHLQSKPDGTERPCGDFRKVNERTVQDAYNLPNLNQFTNHIKKSKFFSKIDILKAFHFVPIKESDQLKTCVATPWGIFKFKRMAFGLRNAPMSFQKFINEVLEDIPNCYAYLDDILLFSDTEDSHLDLVEKVFRRLAEYGLAIALPKCKFQAAEVDFLGYKVNNTGVSPLSYKLDSIKAFPQPQTQKQLLRFLGMLNFYRKTLPNIKKGDKLVTPADILQKLYTAATIKMPKQKFNSYWIENDLNQSFEDAKELLTKCVTLTFPDPKNPLALSCDASDKAIGGVLEELQGGQWRPLGFWSRFLSPSQRNWSIFRRELLSIQKSIRHFLPDIYGRDLTVFTDHKSILSAITAPALQQNDPVASRQLLEISNFTHDIRFKPGKYNLTADQMSRPIGVPPGNAYVPDSIASLKQIITEEISPFKIVQEQQKCPELQAYSLGKHSPHVKLQPVKFKGHDVMCDVTTERPRPYIPASLCTYVLKSCHNLDHCGQAEAKTRAKKYYF